MRDLEPFFHPNMRAAFIESDLTKGAVALLFVEGLGTALGVESGEGAAVTSNGSFGSF